MLVFIKFINIVLVALGFFSSLPSAIHSQQLSVCSNKYGLNFLSGVCSGIDECQGAAFLGNCSNTKQICCMEEKVFSFPANSIITKQIFLKITGNTPRNSFLYNYFSESMQLAKINTKYQASAYLSQLIGETDYFRSIESPKPEPDYSGLIGNTVVGAGSTYRGRGAILLRGLLNYQLANASLFRTVGYDLVSNPERVAFPSIAFKVGAWFWDKNAYVIKSDKPAIKESLSILADGTFLNFTHMTHSLTNNLNSLAQRANVNDLIIKELNQTNIKRGQGFLH
jgi:predicted chitinase